MALKNLREIWPKLKKYFLDKYLLLFLDYDGTLTPIVESPKEALLPSKNKAILEKLSQRNDCRITIVSGRALKDVRRMVGIRAISYVGNHGLEIDGPDIHFEGFIVPSMKAVLDELKDELMKKIAMIPGAWLEDKGLTYSIHFRQVAPRNISKLSRIFEEACHPYLARREVRVGLGYKVFEIRPPIEWDKGKAAMWFLNKQKRLTSKRSVLPVYMGDDETDEDAFVALKHEGLTVLVGVPRKTKAKYFLSGPPEVTWILQEILMLKGSVEDV